MKRSPLSLKQNGGVYDFSDNYESSQYEDEEDSVKNKKLSNFARFMEPFRKNDNKKWYNEDSYYSFDIVNMNNEAKNKNFLYQKPIKFRPKQMNKNNSMYIKRVVHFESKINSFNSNYNENNLNDLSDINSRNKNDLTDYEEKDNNVYDFDAPKSIKDTIDNNNIISTDFVNVSSKESQSKLSSHINNKKNNTDSMNINTAKKTKALSKKNTEKIIYMKKLNTVYNFYHFD